MLDCTSSASRPNATSTRLGYIVTSRRCHARLASFSWRIFASEDLVLLHQFQLWLELEAEPDAAAAACPGDARALPRRADARGAGADRLRSRSQQQVGAARASEMRKRIRGARRGKGAPGATWRPRRQQREAVGLGDFCGREISRARRTESAFSRCARGAASRRCACGRRCARGYHKVTRCSSPSSAIGLRSRQRLTCTSRRATHRCPSCPTGRRCCGGAS